VSAVTVAKISKYTFKTERSSEDVGPFVGDDTVTEIPGGKKGTMTLEGIIPEGGDAGQDDLLDAYEAGTTLRTEVITDKAKNITFATAYVKTVEIDTEAKGGPKIKFEISGAYTVTQDT
jgi:hypothetical protein